MIRCDITVTYYCIQAFLINGINIINNCSWNVVILLEPYSLNPGIPDNHIYNEGINVCDIVLLIEPALKGGVPWIMRLWVLGLPPTFFFIIPFDLKFDL